MEGQLFRGTRGPAPPGDPASEHSCGMLPSPPVRRELVRLRLCPHTSLGSADFQTSRRLSSRPSGRSPHPRGLSHAHHSETARRFRNYSQKEKRNRTIYNINCSGKASPKKSPLSSIWANAEYALAWILKSLKRGVGLVASVKHSGFETAERRTSAPGTGHQLTAPGLHPCAAVGVPPPSAPGRVPGTLQGKGGDRISTGRFPRAFLRVLFPSFPERRWVTRT